MDSIITKHALQNAVLHGGHASVKAVLGKVLSELPELRKNVEETRRLVEQVVNDVNSISPEEQERRAKGFSFHEKRVRGGLPEIEHDETVVTRFAPAPTGPLNILHALRAVFINVLYARKYGGAFILRFEDTDPATVEKAFYRMIREDLHALGVAWDSEIVESGHMDLFYTRAEILIEMGRAYVCFCPPREFQLLKQKRRDCPCRWSRPDKNILGWKGMLSGRYGAGKAVVRLLTSMQEPNPAMRDPPLLRVVETAHPLQKGYRVWPLYNFANAVMDNFCRVTHVFRGKEHEHNTAIQERIYRAFGEQPPRVVNFGMMYLPGEKLHTRDMKAGIADKRFSGWDDLRLPTVRSFLRRGFVPEAIREFAKSCGLSKTDIRIDIGNLEAINRRIVDPLANRYMAVLEPVAIDVSGILVQTGMGAFVEMKNHPEHPETRRVAVSPQLFVSGGDFRRFAGRGVRLLGLFNVILGATPTLAESQEFDMKTPKIQWVAKKHVAVNILHPEKTVAGMGEEAIKNVKAGEIIQLLRIGFCRVEKPGTLVFGHK